MNAFVADNPFSTRHTRPGAIAFRFDGGESVAALVDQLREWQWWGQIVGPHGSGKSTLLAALLPALKAAGRQVELVTLHQGDRRLPFDRASWRRRSSATQLVIDGYEQLTWFARRSLTRHCRRYSCGLLVTSHDDVGLQTLFTTRPSLELARKIVRGLVGTDDALFTDADIESAWHARNGNLREMLFDLYDAFEDRRRER
jgi:hypothetical protein